MLIKLFTNFTLLCIFFFFIVIHTAQQASWNEARAFANRKESFSALLYYSIIEGKSREGRYLDNSF